MKKSLKIVSIIGLVLLMLGATVLVYGTMQTSNNQKCKNPPDNRPPANRPPDNRPPSIVLNKTTEGMLNLSVDQLKYFLNHATAVQVNGSVAILVNDMLAVDTVGGQVRIFLPENCTVNHTIVSRSVLFNGTFSGAGQNVTVKVLKSIIFEHNNFDINIMVGYEIINAKGIHAFALLPFNIETNP